MTATVPALNSQGWIIDPANKLDRLLTYMFLTDYNQSYLYKGKMTSVQALFAEAGNDSDRLMMSLKPAIANYLKNYYDDVEVDVSVNTNDVDYTHGMYNLILSIGLNDNNVNFNFARSINMSGSLFQKIIRINNQGF